MDKMKFNISIDASPAKVWDVLLGEKTYPMWTSVFSPTSSVQTDWKKGSKAIFGDGTGNGMVSRIAEHIPNEFISIEHLGEVHGGVEDTTSEAVKQWAGAHENYTVKSVDGKTELFIEIDSNDEFKEMFEGTWPKALDIVKNLSEK